MTSQEVGRYDNDWVKAEELSGKRLFTDKGKYAYEDKGK